MNKIITIIAALFVSAVSFAEVDNSYDFEHNGIRYRIISEENRTVETICYELSQYYDVTPYEFAEEEIILPEKLLHDGKEYTLVRLGQLSFAETTPKRFILPLSITEIGASAFKLSNLEEIQGIDSVSSILGFSFGSTNIQEFIFPDKVKTVNLHTFMLCHRLRRIEFKKNTEYICQQALVNNNPCEIKCNAITPPELGGIGFYGMEEPNRPKNTWLVVPRQSIEKYRESRGWEIFKDKTLPDDYALDTPLLFESDGLFFSEIPGSNNLVAIVRPPKQFMEHPYGYGIGGKFTVPSKVSFQGKEYTVHTIGGFMDSEYEEIVLPPTVKVIDRLAFIHSKVRRINTENIIEVRHQAFQGSELEEIKLYDGVTLSIDGTFFGCSNLTKVDLPETISIVHGGNIYDTEYRLFCDCPNLKELICRFITPFRLRDYDGRSGYDLMFQLHDSESHGYNHISPTVWVPKRTIEIYREEWSKYINDFRELEEEPVAIGQVNSDNAYAISIANGRANITGVEGATVTITSVSGQNVYTTSNAPAEIAISLQHGVYLLTINGSVTKFCI